MTSTQAASHPATAPVQSSVKRARKSEEKASETDNDETTPAKRRKREEKEVMDKILGGSTTDMLSMDVHTVLNVPQRWRAWIAADATGLTGEFWA